MFRLPLLFPAGVPGERELVAILAVQLVLVVLLGLAAVALYRRLSGGR